LRQHAETIVLVFDGDDAGLQAAERALGLFLAHVVDVRVLTLPDGRDPCDLLVAEGARRFNDLVSSAGDALSFVLGRAADRFDTSTLDGAYRAVETVLAKLVPASGTEDALSAARGMRQQMLLDRLSHRFRLPEAHLRRRLTELRGRGRRTALPAGDGARQSDLPRFDPLERELLEVVLSEPAFLAEVREAVSLDDLANGPLRDLLATCFALDEQGEVPTYHRLTAELEDAQLKRLLTDLDETAQRKGNARRRLEGALHQLAHRRAARRQRDLEAELREAGGDDRQEVALLEQIQKQQQQIHGQLA
jgi:DNA primase